MNNLLDNYMRQAAEAEILMAKIRERIIREALARGAKVTEIMDEIVIEEPAHCAEHSQL